MCSCASLAVSRSHFHHHLREIVFGGSEFCGARWWIRLGLFEEKVVQECSFELYFKLKNAQRK